MRGVKRGFVYIRTNAPCTAKCAGSVRAACSICPSESKNEICVRRSCSLPSLRSCSRQSRIADGVDAETASALNTAVDVLARLGGSVQEIRVPDVSNMIWDWFPICAVQTARAHAATFPSRRDEYGPALTQLLDMGIALSGIEYQELLLRRLEFRGRVDAMFADIDVLALPVLAFPVPSLERMANIDDELIAGLHRFTCPFNLSGHPGIVLPCGSNAAGLPIVFQLIEPHFTEEQLIAAGGAYQSTTQWHETRTSER